MFFRGLEGKYIVYVVCVVYLIHSCFDYTVVLFFLFLINVTVWSPPTALFSKSMEQTHPRFVSHMCHDVGFVKVTLAECHQFYTIAQVYKILHHLVPAYLQDTFMFAKDFTGFAAAGRNRHHLFIPRMKTEFGQRSLF